MTIIRAKKYVDHYMAEETGGRVLNLFYPSKKFCAVCQNWDKYNEMEMSVILRPAKRCVIVI